MSKENKDLKQNLEIQNKNMEMIKRELFLVKEILGKRPMKINQTLDYLLKENVALKKIISDSNISEKKSMDLLIKKFNEFS